MITIAEYINTTDAYIAKGLLESEGIPCELKNEMIGQTLPVGGVLLQVNEEDVERAQTILNDSDI